jgi:hypothetical protein
MEYENHKTDDLKTMNIERLLSVNKYLVCKVEGHELPHAPQFLGPDWYALLGSTPWSL